VAGSIGDCARGIEVRVERSVGKVIVPSATTCPYSSAGTMALLLYSQSSDLVPLTGTLFLFDVIQNTSPSGPMICIAPSKSSPSFSGSRVSGAFLDARWNTGRSSWVTRTVAKPCYQLEEIVSYEGYVQKSRIITYQFINKPYAFVAIDTRNESESSGVGSGPPPEDSRR
jgi:hypothetical protein